MLSRLLTSNGLDSKRMLAQGPFVNANTLTAHDFLGAELTGTWWLLRQDGTNAPGAGQTLSAVGSPGTAQTTLGGASFTAITLNGTTQYYKTADVASPVGDFTIVSLVRRRTAGVVHNPLSKMSSVGGGANYSINHTFDASNLSTATLYKTSAAGTAVNSGAGNTHLADTWYTVALPYDFVTDGTSVMRMRRNGVAVGTGSTTAVGPMQAATGSGWWVGASGFSGGSGFMHGDIGLALMTEKVLSDATLLALHEYLFYFVPVTLAIPVANKGIIEFDWVPGSATGAAERFLFDGLSGNDGIRILVREAAGNNQVRVTHGDSSATNDTDSSNLTWTAAQTYRIRVQWRADGSSQIWRDGTSIGTATARKVPTAFPATWALGAIIGGASNNCAGAISNFKWWVP